MNSAYIYISLILYVPKVCYSLSKKTMFRQRHFGGVPRRQTNDRNNDGMYIIYIIIIHLLYTNHNKGF